MLGNQNCSLSVYMLGTCLFVDTAVNGVIISAAVLGRTGVSLVPTTYLGFLGQLLFVDTQGTSDPTYDGLGSRYQLLYATPADIAGAQ